MLEKLGNIIYKTKIRPFIIILLLNALYFLFVYGFTLFKPLSNESIIPNSFYILSILLFTILGLIYISKATQKIKQIGFVSLSLVSLIVSFAFLEPYSLKIKYQANQNYINNEFESTCKKALNGQDLKNKMN